MCIRDRLALIAEDLAPARVVEGAEDVKPAVRQHSDVVPALFARKSLRLAETHALEIAQLREGKPDAEEMVLGRGYFGGGVI